MPGLSCRMKSGGLPLLAQAPFDEHLSRRAAFASGVSVIAPVAAERAGAAAEAAGAAEEAAEAGACEGMSTARRTRVSKRSPVTCVTARLFPT